MTDFIKLTILLLYNAANALLGIHPKKLKIYIHRKTYTQIFTAALFIIPKLGSNKDVLQ